MTLIKGYYDDIHFTESNIGGFEYVENNLIIEIDSGLEIYPPHPLASSHTMADPCKLIFTNVISSKRDLDLYAGDPKTDGFKGREIIIDKASQLEVEEPYQEYGVEGVLLPANAWVTWEIIAEDFFVDDLRN